MGLIRAAVLTDYPVVARRLGLDPTGAPHAVGLNHAAIEQPQPLISSDAMVRLLEDSAARTGCPSVGLQLAQMRKLSHFGVVSLLLAHQRTLRDVVQMGLQYLTPMNPSVALHLEDTGKIAVLHHAFLTDQPMPASQAAEPQAAGTTFSALLTAIVLRVLRCPERDGLLIRDPEQPGLDLEARID